jgi:hypothetical protein
MTKIKRGSHEIRTEAEDRMSESEFKQADTSAPKISDMESRVPESLDSCPDEMEFAPLMSAEELSLVIERFSIISSELTGILSRLAQEVVMSAEQLDRVRSAVDSKKEELKTLHGIEATAVALERLVLDHQRQKEALDLAMASQRAEWEEEKANRAQEEREYLEHLRVRREREEEEYRQVWAAEKLRKKEKLEEELKAVQQEHLQKQQEKEGDYIERELRLKEKELEWVRLIEELEQFMSKLAQRAKAQTVTHPGAALKKEPYSTAAPDFVISEPAKTDIESGFGNELPGEPWSRKQNPE